MAKYKSSEPENSQDAFRLIPRLHKLLTEVEKVEDLVNHHSKKINPLLKNLETVCGADTSCSSPTSKYSLCEAFDLLESLEYKLFRLQDQLADINERVMI